MGIEEIVTCINTPPNFEVGKYEERFTSTKLNAAGIEQTVKFVLRDGTFIIYETSQKKIF